MLPRYGKKRKTDTRFCEEGWKDGSAEGQVEGRMDRKKEV